jgi:prolipoprotein diacylglyceryl transferase
VIPSPPDNAIGIDPLQLRAYGVAIALGVLAAVQIASRRYERKGGKAEDLTAVAIWAVPAGLVGARAYHVLTDFHRFEGRWLHAFAVWEGGLGIPGGLLLGTIAGVIVARRRGLDVPLVADAAAPAIPVAQAIGRLGNWFNQELFGRPTDLPWGLQIDAEHRPAGYEQIETYHPTFLYEAVWNLALAWLLIRIDRTGRLARGQLFVLYVGGYALGRLWVEALRIDPASEILGLRVNVWTSLLTLAGAAIVFVVRARRATARGVGGADDDEPRTVTPSG